MNRLLTILMMPLLMFLASSCMEDALENSHDTEMYYVDLLYALHHHDQTGAKTAVRNFTNSISGLYLGNDPLRKEGQIEDMRFHLNMSEHSYLEVRASIEQGELEQAMIQLNRATAALEAARVPGFEELYIARIHGFLGSWLEVSRTSQKEDMSSKDWRAINRRIKTAYTNWRECQWIRPSQSIYFFSDEDSKEFTLAHAQVDRLVELLKASLAEDDEVLTKSYIDAADSAVWALIRRFGSPKEGGLKISPPETDPSR
jgi:hypothetical protein